MRIDARFQATLKQLRTKRGLTQEELAEAAGLSRDAIVRLERGDRQPRFGTLNALADGLGVDVGELWARGAVSVGRDRRASRLRRIERFLDNVPEDLAERIVRAVAMLCKPLNQSRTEWSSTEAKAGRRASGASRSITDAVPRARGLR